MDISLIREYFELDADEKDLFERFSDLLYDWNTKINLISRKDPESLMEKHILHSLAIAVVADFAPGSTIMDVGTGGGLPGIPLAILFPECNFLLVDSIGKKINVVNEMAEELGLTNLKGIKARAEDVDEEFDFVVSRAVTSLDKFYPWVKKKIKKESLSNIPNGILYIKGGDFDKELDGIDALWKKHSIYEMYKREFFETKYVVHIY